MRQYQQIDVDTANVTVPVEVMDSACGTGGLLPGVLASCGSFVAYYMRAGTACGAVAISLCGGTHGTYGVGSWNAMDATNFPGRYELGLPDAVCACGARYAVIRLSGATNMVPVTLHIDLKSAAAAGTLTAAQVRTEMDANSTQLAAIKAKTDTINRGLR